MKSNPPDSTCIHPFLSPNSFKPMTQMPARENDVSQPCREVDYIFGITGQAPHPTADQILFPSGPEVIRFAKDIRPEGCDLRPRKSMDSYVLKI